MSEADPGELSHEAAVYLQDLRTLPFDEFRKRRSSDGSANAARAHAERLSEQKRGRR